MFKPWQKSISLIQASTRLLVCRSWAQVPAGQAQGTLPVIDGNTIPTRGSNSAGVSASSLHIGVKRHYKEAGGSRSSCLRLLGPCMLCTQHTARAQSKLLPVVYHAVSPHCGHCGHSCSPTHQSNKDSPILEPFLGLCDTYVHCYAGCLDTWYRLMFVCMM